MKKIFLIFTLLFIFNSSIKAKDALSGNIEPKANNIVKVNVGGVLLYAIQGLMNLKPDLTLPISYERVITNKLSFEIGITSTIIDGDGNDNEINYFSNFGADVALRYYFYSDSAPIGFYLSPSLVYGGEGNVLGPELLIGYQHIMGNTSIFFDIALGAGYEVYSEQRSWWPTALLSMGYPF
ncbi:hypothetical protein [Ichthyobacterium seriolicida]|uniref:Secreted protein n=1 Tax=Ichthyobacterium seriolicida TaxID=242600 RepID=A0A1J1DW94_9FLAO|nr:hypothetical protein [Ichthyobacterium seriolicida]BAV94135.1 hypothetical protein JBKA6_0122 [Ichthyobacterium seriolicida]